MKKNYNKNLFEQETDKVLTCSNKCGITYVNKLV